MSIVSLPGDGWIVSHLSPRCGWTLSKDAVPLANLFGRFTSGAMPAGVYVVDPPLNGSVDLGLFIRGGIQKLPKIEKLLGRFAPTLWILSEAIW